ncbi:hypothetical protein X768_14575 [Mesorhizobium sp. LSJC265A00]|nr:hypothetical protein X768_14575 [Mesorhizobium sp. LSJC265A00]
MRLSIGLEDESELWGDIERLLAAKHGINGNEKRERRISQGRPLCLTASAI